MKNKIKLNVFLKSPNCFKHPRLKLLALFILFSFPISAQEIPTGTWRTHISYFQTQNVAIANERVYASSENGLFYFDKSDNSVQIISRLDGLSDNGIADLAFAPAQNTLVIAYRNGNIDLIQDGEIINVRTLLNSSRPNKSIRSVQILGNLAIFSTGFGGVELDLNSLTIRDFYENIGGMASESFITASTADSLYLATNLGVFGVSLNSSVNKQDFNNWTRVFSNGNVRQMQVFNGKLYLSVSNDRLYSYENGNLQSLNIGVGVSHTNLVSAESNLYLIADQKIIQINSSETVSEITASKIINPQDLRVDGASVFVADLATGLVNRATNENFFPSGPFSSDAFQLLNFQNKMLATAGGFTDNGQPENNPASFYVFKNASWQNFTSATNFIGATELPNLTDLTGIAYDAQNQQVYLGSFGGGVLLWNLATNEFSVVPDSPDAITDLAIDGNAVLWATSNSGGVHKLEAGNWQQVETAIRPVEILIDEIGNKWIRQKNGGVLVFNETGSKRVLNHSEATGNLRGDFPSSLALDRNGSIWVGTDDGITEFFDPFSIFSGGTGTFVRDTEGNVVLRDATVSAISVDGGNRKWLGTSNNGVFLYDDNGELLLNFTTENSPILSNKIIDISIQQQTGEVFFATPQGIISYRGTATEPNATHSNVKVFPNPVEPNFSGQITISGLVANADVKITDIAGQLVFKTRSEGGTATWSGNNFAGGRVQTGVYLIFSSDEEGVETVVAKVAIVQ